MTKIRAMSFVCSCLLASYLPATSHADTMLSPLLQDGGFVNVKGDSAGGSQVDVHFTSMTPIFLEFDNSETNDPDERAWLNFNGLYNDTGIPWTGIEFRVITALFVENDDNYFYFEPLTGVIDNVTQRLHLVDPVLQWDGQQYTIPYGTDPYITSTTGELQTITAPHWLWGTQDIYDYCLATGSTSGDCDESKTHLWTDATGSTQHATTITFADGAPETAGFEFGEFMLYHAGSFWNADTPHYTGFAQSRHNYQILITPIATSAVPVPAAVWLFASGLVGLVGVARRKKRA